MQVQYTLTGRTSQNGLQRTELRRLHVELLVSRLHIHLHRQRSQEEELLITLRMGTLSITGSSRWTSARASDDTGLLCKRIWKQMNARYKVIHRHRGDAARTRLTVAVDEKNRQRKMFMQSRTRHILPLVNTSKALEYNVTMDPPSAALARDLTSADAACNTVFCSCS